MAVICWPKCVGEFSLRESKLKSGASEVSFHGSFCPGHLGAWRVQCGFSFFGSSLAWGCVQNVFRSFTDRLNLFGIFWVRVYVRIPQQSIFWQSASLTPATGLPLSMADVGVATTDLEDCARRTMNDPLVQTNPRKINGWEAARRCEHRHMQIRSWIPQIFLWTLRPLGLSQESLWLQAEHCLYSTQTFHIQTQNDPVMNKEDKDR